MEEEEEAVEEDEDAAEGDGVAAADEGGAGVLVPEGVSVIGVRGSGGRSR